MIKIVIGCQIQKEPFETAWKNFLEFFFFPRYFKQLHILRCNFDYNYSTMTGRFLKPWLVESLSGLWRMGPWK